MSAPGKPFPKGTSGNPGGRPRGLARLVRDTVGDTGWVEIVEEMRAIATGAHDDATARDQISAAAWLTDRGFGRPQQTVDVTSAGEKVGGGQVVVPLPVAEMSDEALANVRATLERATGGVLLDDDDPEAGDPPDLQ